MIGSSETYTNDNSWMAQIRIKISTNQDRKNGLLNPQLPLFYEAHSITFAPSSANEIEGKPVQITGSGNTEECPSTLHLFLSFSV